MQPLVNSGRTQGLNLTNFSHDQQLSLIRAVKSYEFLVDVKNAKFHDKACTEAAWEGVGAEIGFLSPEQCKHVWSQIRTKFGRELNRINETAAEGTLREHTPAWPAFYSLDWLRPYMRNYAKRADRLASLASSRIQSVSPSQDSLMHETLMQAAAASSGLELLQNGEEVVNGRESDSSPHHSALNGFHNESVFDLGAVKLNDLDDTNEQSIAAATPTTTHSRKRRKPARYTPPAAVEELPTSTDLIGEIRRDLGDDIYFYALSVAARLRGFDLAEQYRARQEIERILFDIQTDRHPDIQTSNGDSNGDDVVTNNFS